MYTNLLAEMRRKGLRQVDVAKCLNISPSTLSQKLKRKSEFDLSEAKKIKEFLGVNMPLEELFNCA